MNATTLRERLQRKGPDAPLAQLAALALDALLETPLGEAVDPARLAAYAQAALLGWGASEGAPAALEELVSQSVEALRAEQRPLAQAVPRALAQAVLELAGRPFSPDKRLVMKLIDQQPLRDRIRDLLVDTMADFTHRAPGANVAKGLTGLARFAAGQARARTGGLGALVGAVSDEVQGQVEKRSREFADAALAGVLAEIADLICNPQRAQQAADIRVAVLEGALELEGPQLGRELLNLDVPGGAEVLRAGVQRWLASGAAEAELLRQAERLLAPHARKTLGALASAWGQDAAVRAHLLPALEARLRAVVQRPAFEAWLEALLAAP